MVPVVNGLFRGSGGMHWLGWPTRKASNRVMGPWGVLSTEAASPISPARGLSRDPLDWPRRPGEGYGTLPRTTSYDLRRRFHLTCS